MMHKCQICGTSIGFKGFCYSCRLEKRRNEVLAMDEDQLRAVVDDTLMDLKKAEKDYFHDYNEILCYRGIYSEEVAKAASGAGLYYPSRIFYKASAEVRDSLLHKLMSTTDHREASELMCAAGMQGDDVSLAAFLELENNPRPWREKLYVNPSIYAQIGGWTFDKEGKRIELVFDTCYQLIKGEKASDNAAVVGRAREDKCPSCGLPLVDILALDGTDDRLKFLGVDGIITATCCLNCVSFQENAFSRYTPDGKSELYKWEHPFEEEIYVSEKEYEEFFNNPYVLARDAAPFFFACGDYITPAVGGMGNWVQDWEYRHCPDCGKLMKYYAQLPWDQFMDGMEGTLFFELCTDCGIISMQHQQT